MAELSKEKGQEPVLTGLLLGLFAEEYRVCVCVCVCVKLINHCQAVMIKQ